MEKLHAPEEKLDGEQALLLTPGAIVEAPHLTIPSEPLIQAVPLAQPKPEPTAEPVPPPVVCAKV
jgi:hypothetical protein